LITICITWIDKSLIKYINKLYAVFVYYTKAFDFIVRDIIWYTLLKLGVRGKILDIIMSIF